MKLLKACQIGEREELKTLKDAISNILVRLPEIFMYSEVFKELNELWEEYIDSDFEQSDLISNVIRELTPIQKYNEFESSNILEVEYDKILKKMYITFKGGAEYCYFDVTEGEFEALKEADSVGRFVNKVIKMHEYTKIGEII